MKNTDQLSPQEAVRAGTENLITFGRIFVPRTFRQASPEFHYDMGEALYSPARFNEFLCFRGSAKTTLLRTYTLQRVCYAISRTILYTSISQSHAIHSIRWIRSQIEHNNRLGVFTLRPGSKWTDEWIQIEHELYEIVINLFAVGITGQTRGFNLDDYRPDLIVGDDVLDAENTATVEQRNKTEDRWFGDLMESLAPASEAPRAKMVLAQTPFNKHDLSILLSKDPEWDVRIYSCFDETGQSRWPERWSTEELLEAKSHMIRRGKGRIWYREKECKVVEDENKPFSSDKLQMWEELPAGMMKVITIDPASAGTDSRDPDQNVVLVAGSRGPDVYLCAYDATVGSMPDRTANKFFEYLYQFAPIARTGVEVVAFQKTLKWYLEQEMVRRRTFVPLLGIEASRKLSKADKIVGAISGLLNYGHLHCHPSMHEFISQLDDYDPADKDQHDDILDALAMAIIMINPAVRMMLTDPNTLEGSARVLDTEDNYETLTYGGCP